MNESGNIKYILFSIIMGMVLGILMAGIIIFLMRYSDYKLYSFSFWLILLITCVLPFCVDFLEKRGFSLWIVKLIMIGISLGVVLLYVYAISGSETTKNALTRLTMIYHIASLFFTVIYQWFFKRGSTWD